MSRKHRLRAERRKWMKEQQLARCRNPALARVVERNIEAIEEHRREADRSRSVQDRIADSITRFSGSLPFVYFHVVLFAVWIIVNVWKLPGIPQFDPFPFGLLTMVVSLEAIFLSTFVLVSQNREAEIAERRTELDLQINLLTEHEVTRILTIVDALAKRLNIEACDEHELQELEQDVEPEVVLQELEGRIKSHSGKNRKSPPHGNEKRTPK